MIDHQNLEQFDNIAFRLGSVEIYWYAIFILLGAVCGYFFALRQSRRLGINSDLLSMLFVLGIGAGVIGGRIWYVALKPGEFSSFQSVINIRTGGIAMHGVFTGVVLYVLIIVLVKKLNFLIFLDMVVVSVMIGQIIGRWGNFFNHEAHGGLVPGSTFDAQREWLTKLDLPEFIIDNMFMKSTSEVAPALGYYHPTFLYESLFNLLGLSIILILRRTCKKFYIGDSFFAFMMWWGVLRFWIESMRTDALMIGSLKAAQVASIINFSVGLIGFIVRHAIKYMPISFNDWMENPKINKQKKVKA